MEQIKKKVHMSDSQKKMLVKLVQDDENLVTGTFNNSFTFKEARSRWTLISQQLNSIPGAEKDWLGWKRTWQDVKKTVKKKQADIGRYKRGTGGGPPPKELSNDEVMIVQSLPVDAVEGNLKLEESIITDHDYNIFDVEENMVPAPLRESPKRTPKKSTAKRKHSVKRLDESIKTSGVIATILEKKAISKKNIIPKNLN